MALAARPVPNFPRLRALALFGRRLPRRVEAPVIPASENQHKAPNRCAIARCAGARAEGPVAVERTAIAGWQGQHDQQACCWRATRDRTRLVSSLRPATSSAAPITQ